MQTGKAEILTERPDGDRRPDLDYAICTPYYGALDIDHADCMNVLQQRYKFTRYRVQGCAYIDQARAALCRMVEANGHAGMLFVDHDIIFDPDDAAEIIATAEREQCVVSGVYCMRATGDRIIGRFEATVKEVVCFDGGGLYPGPWSGLGFTAIPRRILDDVARPLPRLRTGWFEEVAPMFALRTMADAWPLRRAIEELMGSDDFYVSARFQHALSVVLEKHCPRDYGWYSGEDISFFHRLAEAGHRLLLDTRPRLWHKGSYMYGLEDRQIAVPRARTLKLELCEVEDPPLVPAGAGHFEGYAGAVGELKREASPA